MVVARHWGASFNGHRISVLKDGKGSRDWLHNNVNALTATELYPSKWLRGVTACYV